MLRCARGFWQRDEDSDEGQKSSEHVDAATLEAEVARLRELVQEGSDHDEHGKKRKKKKDRKGDEEDLSGAEDGDGDGRSKKRKGRKDEESKEKRQRPDSLQEALMPLSAPGASAAAAASVRAPPVGSSDDLTGGSKAGIKPGGGSGRGPSLAGLSAVAAVLSAPFEPAVKSLDKRDGDLGVPGMQQVLLHVGEGVVAGHGGEEAKVADDRSKGKAPEGPRISGRFTKEEDKKLIDVLDRAMTQPNQYEAPPKEFHTKVLCGEKIPDGDHGLSGKTYRNWVRQIWAEAHAALPQRSRTAVYDRGRRLMQDTRKGSWTEEELSRMKAIVDSHPNDRSRIWKIVGEELGRPAAACKDIYRHRYLGRWQPAELRESKNAPHLWSPKESAQLRTLVHQVTATQAGTMVKTSDVSWLKVSLGIKGRSAEQCKARWEFMSASGGAAQGGSLPVSAALPGSAPGMEAPPPPPAAAVMQPTQGPSLGGVDKRMDRGAVDYEGSGAAALLVSAAEAADPKRKKGKDREGDGDEAGKARAAKAGDMGSPGRPVSGETLHTWKLWKREDDVCLAEQVQKQMERRGISHIVDIRWKEIHVPGRLPNHAKERWRRLADKAFPSIPPRDAQLDLLVKHVLSRPNSVDAPASTETVAQAGVAGSSGMSGVPPPPPVDMMVPPPPPDASVVDAGVVIHPAEFAGMAAPHGIALAHQGEFRPLGFRIRA